MKKININAIKEKLLKHKARTGLIVLVLLAVIYFVFKSNQPPKVDTATVKRGTISSVVEASGKVKSKQQTTLGFFQPGKVVWVGVKKGDTVRKYQVLANMDQREVEKAIKTKLLNYMKTRWDFETAMDAKDVHSRPLDIVPNISTEERRALEKSQFGLDQSVLDVEITALAKEQSLIIAPFSGTVIDDGNLYSSEFITAGNMSTKTVTVADLNDLYFEANIDESDYAKIKVGQFVEIILDSFQSQKFDGIVEFISKEAIRKTGGSVQIPIDIKLNTANTALIPELNGDVAVEMEKRADVLTLDKSFVRNINGQYKVSVLSGKKLVDRDIKIGLIGSEEYEITGGLNEGDSVIKLASPTSK